MCYITIHSSMQSLKSYFQVSETRNMWPGWFSIEPERAMKGARSVPWSSRHVYMSYVLIKMQKKN